MYYIRFARQTILNFFLQLIAFITVSQEPNQLEICNFKKNYLSQYLTERD